jgi:tetrapyrrole methylase family protein/MazG family protein
VSLPITEHPVVRIVGLGPAGVEHVTQRTLDLIDNASSARLRTRIHPAAFRLDEIVSYDDWYERADSFDELYASIVEDLVSLARSSATGEVLYIVPGSPTVAERTVELLRARDDVHVILEPAVSIIDMACAALGRDPMSSGLRVIDALASGEVLRGPGPLLVLQTYAPEVLASVASRVKSTTVITVLYHLGLDDEVIVNLNANDLATFESADHLTSLWIDELRTGGDATDDLLDLMRRLRRECPWDQEQDHASLTRHLLEEAYEALDALETFVRTDGDDASFKAASAHVQEELGDLLFQIIFHAELGDEEDLFDFTSISDAVREKLIGRHPHVFGDVSVTGSDDVASRWEVIKRDEKGRTSVTDGIAWQLPALSLYAKLLRKAAHVDVMHVTGVEAEANALVALQSLRVRDDGASDAESSSDVDDAWGDLLTAILHCAQWSGVDLEGVLRERAQMLRDELRAAESGTTG